MQRVLKKPIPMDVTRDLGQPAQLLRLARIYKFGLACLHGPAHEILVFMANALSHSLNIDVLINCVLSLHLHPYFVSVSNNDSG